MNCNASMISFIGCSEDHPTYSQDARICFCQSSEGSQLTFASMPHTKFST